MGASDAVGEGLMKTRQLLSLCAAFCAASGVWACSDSGDDDGCGPCAYPNVCRNGECVVYDANYCGGFSCQPNEVCNNGRCVPNGEACGFSFCYDTHVCRSDKCVLKGEACGSVSCASYEKCREQKCTPGGDACGDTYCQINEKCVDDACVPAGEKCGSVYCYANELCRDGKCAPNGDPCGDTWCYAGEMCRDNVCGIPRETCGDTKCFVTENCIDGVCVQPAEFCGGIACLLDETCLNNSCHGAGDCNGLACNEGETCAQGACRIAGSCGGYACFRGESCKNNECRSDGDCDGISCWFSEYCLMESMCVSRVKCGDVLCEENDLCENDVCVKNPYCINGTERCGSDCCELSQFCGIRKHCCDFGVTCGHDCCDEGEVCINEMCHKDCGDLEYCAQADGTEVCCASDEMCTANQCFKPTVSCIDNYVCDEKQFCDKNEHLCYPMPAGESCKSSEKGGAVVPTLVWHWGVGDLAPIKNNEVDERTNRINVMSAPMVADVNDDGIPEVVFNSYPGNSYEGNGTLRILNGQTGQLLAYSDSTVNTDGGSQVAIGKLYPEGTQAPADKPDIDISGLQIVTCIRDTDNYFKIAAFNHKAEMLWMHDSVDHNECGQSGPGIADFNGDGKPEVFSRYNVYNGQTGELIARNNCGDNLHVHAACDYPLAADLDGDGIVELVGGNVAYKVDFNAHELVQLYKSKNSDGYPAIADINLDGKPEIFVVLVKGANAPGEIMAYNADFTNFWDAPKKHDGGTKGGAPTIANINDTPEPELTFAGETAYLAYDYQGNLLWKRATHDRKSSKTGSTVFDFDGDGKAEIVYNDEFFLRVYDGTSGDTRFCKCNTSGTHYEYPVIADVNLDGHAEIIVAANTTLVSTKYKGCNIPEDYLAENGLDDCVKQILESENEADRDASQGVRVFSSPDQDWIDTRKIYNQHAYSITNVNDNGLIPAHPKRNWATVDLNNFRLNVQPGLTYLPNLVIRNISSPYECRDTLPVYFSVVNDGWAIASNNVDVSVFYAEKESGPYTLYKQFKTSKVLGAGQEEPFHFEYTFPKGVKPPVYFSFSFDGEAPTMCRTDGSTKTIYELTCSLPVN